MKRKKTALVAVAAIAAVVALLSWSFQGGPPLPVRVLSPRPGCVRETVTPNSVGLVEPEKTAVVAAEIAGKILRIHVREGPAAAGKVVFELDARDLEAEREVVRRDIDTSRMRVEQAGLRRVKVEEDLARYRDVDVPQGDVERLRRDLEIAQKDIEIGQSTLKGLEAQLQVIELKIAKARIAAPFEGIVSELHSEEGESVTPGKPLFTILSAGPLLVRAPVDEVDIGRVAVGIPAAVSFDAYPGQECEGTVREIMPSADADQKNNRTVDVKILVPKMPPNVRSGMSANVEIVVKARDNVLYLPTHAIHDDREGKGKFVYVFEAGVARRRAVETGLFNWDTTEIISGVGPNDAVIVSVAKTGEGHIEDGVSVVAAENGR